jgi:AraC-like DNA-binding protein
MQAPVSLHNWSSSTVDPVIQTEYRALASKHLNGPAGKLFAEMTGLHFHITWAPALPHDWTGSTFRAEFPVCRQLAGAGGGAKVYCEACGKRQLARALGAESKGHLFTCRLGVRNHWFPIRLRGLTVGMAYIQAPAGRKEAWRNWKRCRRGPVDNGPHSVWMAKYVGRREFGRAAQLLRFLVQHAQTSSLADLRLTDLTKTSQALSELQAVATRLRGELHGLLPAVHKTAPVLQPRDHAQQIVQSALDYLLQHYGRPLTLQQFAAGVQLSPAYFSSLFTQTVGMPFKRYLTELRVEKARELLSNPTPSVSEIAYAVGYGSENRFRAVFKKVTGLSPKLWRQTLRLPLLTLLTWLLDEGEILENLATTLGL